VAKPRDPLGHEVLKILAIGIREKDGLAPVALEHDVIEATGNMQTWLACQARRVNAESIQSLTPSRLKIPV
jgi:hypothetical protein